MLFNLARQRDPLLLDDLRQAEVHQHQVRRLLPDWLSGPEQHAVLRLQVAVNHALWPLKGVMNLIQYPTNY